jgi:hypothetical protein
MMKKCFGLITVFLLLSVCAYAGPWYPRVDSPVDANWGKAYKMQKENQIIRQDITPDNKAGQEGMDGRAAAIAYDGYLKAFQEADIATSSFEEESSLGAVDFGDN